MRQRLNALVDPVFVCALCILLLNDLWLKRLFPGFVTGKLSDFAGLVVFALFWSAWIPRCRKWIFIFTAVFFAFWKSPASQFMIDAWNAAGIFPLSRTRDLSDLVALAVLPLAYVYKPRLLNPGRLRLLRIPLAVLSVFAFCATSYNSSLECNKKYSFPFSVTELVFRLNHISSECKQTPLSLDFRNADSLIIWGGDTSWVSYGDSIYKYSDTVYIYDRQNERSTDKIDTIYNFVHRNVDTNYIHLSNPVSIYFNADRLLADSSYKYCRCLEARILVKGNNDSSSVTLRSIHAGSCIYPLRARFRKDLEEVATAMFGKEVIRKILWRSDE